MTILPKIMLAVTLLLYGAACGMLGCASTLLLIGPGNWPLYAAAFMSAVVALVQWQIVLDTFRTIQALCQCSSN